jgi:tRNA1Val (adenine37-N6)-methyltransferase
MANPFFRFKEFTVYHDRCAMKVTTDACLFGAWCAAQLAGRSGGRALDIGTGTGLLSLMIAQTGKPSHRCCGDRFGRRHPGGGKPHGRPALRISAYYKEIYLQLDLPQYDIIFSNPPFYEKEIPSAKEAQRTAHHGDGLRWTALFGFLATHLKPDGTVYLLLPYKRRNDLDLLLRRHAFHLYREVIVQPTALAQPSRLMLAFGLEERSTERESIVIANESGYTARFIELLQPYYLYL